MKIKHLILAMTITASSSTFAAEPSGYYSSCEGKNSAALLSALKNVVSSHTNVGYDGLFNVYPKSDVKANGKIWDIYSTKEWPTGSERCGNYSNVGDCWNREHSVPQSWFSEASPMKADAFHVYPTDGKVNGQRSNYPYGECANGTNLGTYNGVTALGRLGTCTFSGYSGKVFEPDDQYKGDIARTYFYMAAAYNDKIASWTQSSFNGTSYPGFNSWTVELLLKWHRQDPVSQKELDRNEAIYGIQKNRNPFIDHPELAEYIWGNKKDQNWDLNAGNDPQISSPVSGSTFDLGIASVGIARSKTMTVKASALTAAVSVSVSGNGFSVSPSSITAANATSTNGATITITYTPSAVGNATGTLTLTSGSLKTTVNLTASAVNGLPVAEATNVSDHSFTANWTNIGDADNGYYTLNVTQDGTSINGYPKKVKAADESYNVIDLDASTAYAYTIASKTLTSNTINVTTHAPIPSIEFLYDGELSIETMPGEPSDAYELTVEIDNIDTDVTITVSAPFELSTDKANWSQKIVISPDQDRIYLRLNSAQEGTFSTLITATAGDYTNDNTEITGRASSTPDFLETFETATVDNTYVGSSSAAEYKGVACKWLEYNTGVYNNDAANAYDGDAYCRFGSTSTSSLTMNEDRTNGIGIIKMYARAWSAKEYTASFVVEYSIDAGITWTQAGTTISIADATPAYKEYVFTVNQSGKVRARIRQTDGKRMCFDNISMTNYRGNSGIDGVESDYKSWDAYCRDNRLCIELAHDSNVAVHGVDGITYVNQNIKAGNTAFDLKPGLYIVVVDDFSRRVVVK